MNVFSRSWKLLGATWSVLRMEKSLALYPLLALFSVLLLTGVLVGGGFALLSLEPQWMEALAAALESSERGGSVPAGLAAVGLTGLFLFYVAVYSTTYYFMTALAAATLMRLDGIDPTLADGLRVASGRLRTIVGFAVISATVGVLLAMLRGNRGRGGIGSGLSLLGGFAWNVASFLVIPVIAAKAVGPVEAVKESAALVRRTWGEQLIGATGLGLVFGLLMVLVAFGAGGLTGGLIGDPARTGVVVAVWSLAALLFVLLALLSSTLTAIYRAALYRYAATGSASDRFDPALIDGAFRRR